MHTLEDETRYLNNKKRNNKRSRETKTERDQASTHRCLAISSSKYYGSRRRHHYLVLCHAVYEVEFT